MAGLYSTSIKLIRALDTVGYTVIMGNSPFIGQDGRQHDYYTIKGGKKAEDGKVSRVDVWFKSPSLWRVTMYLVDMWHIFSDKPLPENERWEEIRKFLIEEGDENYGKYRARYLQRKGEETTR